MEEQILELLKRQGEQLNKIESLLALTKAVLNLDEACNLTGLSKSHIYKLTCWGKIPYYKQSKHLFFDRLELEAWLKTNQFKDHKALSKDASTYVSLYKK
jgi:excisionase family DNA binding protein